jgi:hypothetical protein
MDKNPKPVAAPPSSSATTARPAATPRNGIVRSGATNEELQRLGFRVLPPSGKAFVILTGPHFKR